MRASTLHYSGSRRREFQGLFGVLPPLRIGGQTGLHAAGIVSSTTQLRLTRQKSWRLDRLWQCPFDEQWLRPSRGATRLQYHRSNRGRLTIGSVPNCSERPSCGRHSGLVQSRSAHTADSIAAHRLRSRTAQTHAFGARRGYDATSCLT